MQANLSLFSPLIYNALARARTVNKSLNSNYISRKLARENYDPDTRERKNHFFQYGENLGAQQFFLLDEVTFFNPIWRQKGGGGGGDDDDQTNASHVRKSFISRIISVKKGRWTPSRLGLIRSIALNKTYTLIAPPSENFQE